MLSTDGMKPVRIIIVMLANNLICFNLTSSKNIFQLAIRILSFVAMAMDLHLEVAMIFTFRIIATPTILVIAIFQPSTMVKVLTDIIIIKSATKQFAVLRMAKIS